MEVVAIAPETVTATIIAPNITIESFQWLNHPLAVATTPEAVTTTLEAVPTTIAIAMARSVHRLKHPLNESISMNLSIISIIAGNKIVIHFNKIVIMSFE